MNIKQLFPYTRTSTLLSGGNGKTGVQEPTSQPTDRYLPADTGLTAPSWKSRLMRNVSSPLVAVSTSVGVGSLLTALGTLPMALLSGGSPVETCATLAAIGVAGLAVSDVAATPPYSQLPNRQSSSDIPRQEMSRKEVWQSLEGIDRDVATRIAPKARPEGAVWYAEKTYSYPGKTLGEIHWSAKRHTIDEQYQAQETGMESKLAWTMAGTSLLAAAGAAAAVHPVIACTLIVLGGLEAFKATAHGRSSREHEQDAGYHNQTLEALQKVSG